MKINTKSLFKNQNNATVFFNKYPHWRKFSTDSLGGHSNIFKAFHDVMAEEIALNRYGAELPLRLGHLYVASYRPKKVYYNFHKLKLGQKMPHLNLHTDGLKCRIMYSNHSKRYHLKDRYVWELKSSKNMSKIVSKAYAEDFNKYIFHQDRKEAEYRLILSKIDDMERGRLEEFLKNYDEFEMI